MQWSSKKSTFASLVTRFCVRWYSARRARPVKLNTQKTMDDERDAFYVVRKGNIVGLYKNLSDCQDQVSSSVRDPSVTVYKGYSLPKETEEYLAARGFKNPLYTIDASDVKDDLFGRIVPCPFQQPDGLAFLNDKTSKKPSPKKRPKEIAVGLVGNVQGSSLTSEFALKQHKSEYIVEAQPLRSKYLSCILEFDGASKGNPGKAGAGVILRSEDGRVISRVRQGLGVVTNNVAEYRALILGLRYAHDKGYRQILARGDSQLVCMQVQGLWQTKHQNMIDLCKVVNELRNLYVNFDICHVKREFNSDADAQANLAIDLASGDVFEECC